MNYDTVKAAAIAKLLDAGHITDPTATDMAICRDIRVVTGQSRPRSMPLLAYMDRFVGQPVAPKDCTFIPQKATAPDWGKRPEYKPPVHFRDDEINRMPRPIAMSGPGIGGDNGMGRGR